MESRARDLHDFFNVASQTVDVRKSPKIVMESKIVSNTTYKTHIKNVDISSRDIYGRWIFISLLAIY